MEHKDGLWKYFVTEKKDICHMPFESIILNLPYLPFWLTIVVHRGAEWVGSFLKNFQKGGRGYRNHEVLVILYVVIVATKMYTDIILFQHFLT